MIDPYQSSEKGSEAQLQMLMALFADVTDKMIVIADELRSKPAVKTATRGCDIRKYRGEFRFGGKGFYDFEAYVEAEMPDGSLVCWLVDINSRPRVGSFTAMSVVPETPATTSLRRFR